MSTIFIGMAAKKSTKTKKVTEIPEAKVKIEVEEAKVDDEKEEDVEEETESKVENKKVEEEKDSDDSNEAEGESKESKEKETEEPEVENFEDEKTWFTWTRVFLFIVIAAITGFVIVGGYLVFVEGYNFSIAKQQPKEKSIDVKETTPTPTPVSVDKSAYDIEVQNGSGIAGEAANVQGILEDAGFSVSDIGNADTSDYTKTQIVYVKKVNQDYLDELETTLKKRGPVEMVKADNTQTQDVVVIVGSDTSAEDTSPSPTPVLE